MFENAHGTGIFYRSTNLRDIFRENFFLFTDIYLIIPVLKVKLLNVPVPRRMKF